MRFHVASAVVCLPAFVPGGPAAAQGDAPTENPMHAWLSRDSAALREDIRSGKMQAIYRSLFREE